MIDELETTISYKFQGTSARPVGKQNILLFRRRQINLYFVFYLLSSAKTSTVVLLMWKCRKTTIFPADMCKCVPTSREYDERDKPNRTEKSHWLLLDFTEKLEYKFEKLSQNMYVCYDSVGK